jgi:serine/threonine-protein kinase
VTPADCKGYQVWGKLSSGGMGDVWLARHRELALPVVIKTIRPSSSADEAYRRMLREARLMARLTTPRVVRVIDVGSWASGDDTGELPFLVQEYVDGIDLGEYARRRMHAIGRALPLWAVAQACADAARGLHEGHQAGVIHRDVKPSNLFLFGHAEVKVGDFGVAVASASDGDAAPAGTPAFMAPEQLRGDRIDRRADVYGLGATAFALRYGRPPFDAPSEVIDGCAPHFPEPRSPDEAYFQHVIARMMAHERDQRHANLMAARQYLTTIAAGRPRLETMRAGRGDYLLGRTRLRVERGSIAAVDADAIVNSANCEMTMRTGTGEAIRKAGGDAIEDEAIRLGPRALGDCVVTTGGRLPYRGVLHAVGGWNEVSCVARATHRAILLGSERGYRRIAFPAIGTGQGRVSLESCADSILSVLVLHGALGGLALDEVRIVLADEDAHRRFCEVAEGLLFDGQDDGDVDAVAPVDDPSSAPTVAS